MQKILMPVGTALWLKANTKLTDRQIALFCNLALMDINAVSIKPVQAFNPLGVSLTKEEIYRCEQDSSLKLQALELNINIKPKSIDKNKRASVVRWFLNRGANWQKLIKSLHTNSRFISKISNEPHIIEEHPQVLGITEEEIKRLLKN